jgi:hypothetical protein
MVWEVLRWVEAFLRVMEEGVVHIATPVVQERDVDTQSRSRSHWADRAAPRDDAVMVERIHSVDQTVANRYTRDEDAVEVHHDEEEGEEEEGHSQGDRASRSWRAVLEAPEVGVDYPIYETALQSTVQHQRVETRPSCPNEENGVVTVTWIADHDPLE